MSDKTIGILSFHVDFFLKQTTLPQKNNPINKKKPQKEKNHHKAQRKLLCSPGIDGKPAHKHLFKLDKLITDSLYFKHKLHCLKPLGSHLLFVYKKHHKFIFNHDSQSAIWTLLLNEQIH